MWRRRKKKEKTLLNVRKPRCEARDYEKKERTAKVGWFLEERSAKKTGR